MKIRGRGELSSVDDVLEMLSHFDSGHSDYITGELKVFSEDGNRIARVKWDNDEGQWVVV